MVKKITLCMLIHLLSSVVCLFVCFFIFRITRFIRMPNGLNPELGLAIRHRAYGLGPPGLTAERSGSVDYGGC